MKIIKSHFDMHSRFRNGIFLLSIVLFLILIFFYFFKNSDQGKTNFKELIVFQKQVDSLRQVMNEEKKIYKIRPFNPNYITDHKGYVLGMSTEELDRLYGYRELGKWVNSIEEFKTVTNISDSLLQVIAPFFKFPKWIQESKKQKGRKKMPILSFAEKKDLNKVSAEELEKKIGVPDFISKRIVNYRKKLNGFIDDLQLKDVSGIYQYQRNKILALYTVKSKKIFDKIDINKASVKELMKVPYFDFETALEIRDFVKKENGISNINELKKVEGFSLEKIDRIALYLEFN